MAALQPLQVPGIDQPITGGNVIKWMEQSWEAPVDSTGTIQEKSTSDWWSKRKNFMGDLMAAALAKVQGGGGLNPAALGKAALAMLDGRHLQVAVDDPALAKVLAGQGWDGGLRPPAEGDFLAVVDSNVGFNKVNAAVKQQIAYRVEPAGGGLTATLVLTYTHTAPAGSEPVCDRASRYGGSYADLINRCYWDYLRVYAPGGSELLAADGVDHAAAEPGERGTTMFTGDFTLRPGDQTTITVRYRLPAAVHGRTLSPHRPQTGRDPGPAAARDRSGVPVDEQIWGRIGRLCVTSRQVGK